MRPRFSRKKRLLENGHATSKSNLSNIENGTCDPGDGKKTSRQKSKNVIMVILFALGIAVFLDCVRKVNLVSFKKPNTTCVLTISPLNEFGFVWSLYDSTMNKSPGIDCFVWVMSDSSNPTDENAISMLADMKKWVEDEDDFTFVTMEDISAKVENFDHLKLAFMYDHVELKTAIKPFAFQYVFKVIRADATIYLDNDVWVISSLEMIQDKLTKKSAIFAGGAKDTQDQTDLTILSSGVYNLGFVAFSNTPTSMRFLKWWGERLASFDFTNPDPFHEETWDIFIPTFFQNNYFVIEDERYRISFFDNPPSTLYVKHGDPHLCPNWIFWGIGCVRPSKSQKVVFMHFTGLSSLKTADLYDVSRPQVRSIFKRVFFERFRTFNHDMIINMYMKLTISHESQYYREIPYGYDYFSDTMKIEPWMRKLYASVVVPVGDSKFVEAEESLPYKQDMSPYIRSFYKKNVFSDPFCLTQKCGKDTSKMSFLEWLLNTTPVSAVDMNGKHYFSALEHIVWEQHPDVQEMFPDPRNEQYNSFKWWFQHHAVDEGIISKELLDKWQDTWNFHKINHYKFHKKIISEHDVGVNVIGWIGGLFGIGISAQKMVQSARLVNIPVNAIETTMNFNVKFIHPNDMIFDLSRSCSEPVNLVVLNALDTFIFTDDIPKQIREKKYNIGFWAWELDIVPPDWMPLLNEYDEVWCPSSFIKEALERSPGYDGTVVKVLPIPFEPPEQGLKISAKMPISIQKYFRVSSDDTVKPFVFLVVFDFHSRTERKNPEAAIIAFLQAFPAWKDKEKKYQLIVKSNSGNTDELNNLIELAKGDPRVVFIQGHLSDIEKQELHQYQDCYISLHRGEGYGMNILEALGYGIPVIATNYSGNVDFFEAVKDTQEKCNFPVPYELVELEETIGPFLKGNRWAEPDIGYTMKAMRSVAENDCKRLHGAQMSRQIIHHYGPKAIGATMKKLLSESFPSILLKQGC